MVDKIIIKDLRAHGIIGVYPHERERPQEILINVIVYTDTVPAAQSDDIAESVDYDMLAKKLKALAESVARQTVEALANDLAQLCLLEKGVEKVIVRVEKPDAILDAASVGVEIERSKEP